MPTDDTLRAIEALSREAHATTGPAYETAEGIPDARVERLNRIVLDIMNLAAYPDSHYSRNLTALLTVK